MLIPYREINFKTICSSLCIHRLGAEYASKKKGQLYLSPFTSKMTFVLDQRLANQGAFGVVKGIYDLDGTLLKEGEKSKIELGFY
jgi:hypothetical protein